MRVILFDRLLLHVDRRHRTPSCFCPQTRFLNATPTLNYRRLARIHRNAQMKTPFTDTAT